MDMEFVPSVTRLSIWQMIFIGTLTFIVWKIIRGVNRFRKYHEYFNAMPGETDFHWIYGNLHKVDTPSKRIAFVDAVPSRFPVFHRIWNGPLACLIICVHSKSAKEILRSSEPKPRGFGTPYILGIDWLGDGLLISNGPKWARNRKLLTPAFHFDILQPYIEVKNKAADTLLDKIDRCVKQNKSFELFEYISLCTLDILLRCAFSYTDNIQELGEKHPYIKAIHELGEAWVIRSITPYLFFDFMFYMTSRGRQFKKNCKFVHDFAEKIIEKRRQELFKDGASPDGSDGRKYMDFIDTLLKARDENNEGLSPLEIRNEADTFLFEGHDTTTSGLSWIMYSLATHPEYQRKIQEEVDEVFKEKDTNYLSLRDLQKMEYMGMCVKEGLRLHSPVPFIERELTKEIEIDGYKLPPGTPVAVMIYNLHMNPAVWDDPDEYRPDRFLPENVKNRDSFAFVPFSAGPRNCIGQNFAMHEMKVLLARILHKYTIEIDESIPVQRKMSIVMKAENGIHVFARPRKVEAMS